MLNSAFDDLDGVRTDIDFAPPAKMDEIAALNAYVYQRINNGAYKAGFSSNQAVHERACDAYFQALASLNDLLATRPFLAGDAMTEADVRLLPTIYRHDPVYFARMKLSKGKIARDFAHIQQWLERMLAAVPPHANNLTHCRNGYFGRTGNGIVPAPNVVYDVVMEDGTEVEVTNPSEFPEGKIHEVREPVVKATILSPSDYIGTIMELCQTKRGTLGGMDYLSEDRVEMRYTLPMGEIVFDFFDQLKSRTKGYASLDYERSGDQSADLVKVDILLQGEPVDAFSAIVHKDAAYSYGVMMAGKLKELIPRQQFEVPIQAAIGARVIARENIRAIRKDVLAKCYGGDISRKRKLLEKQKEGKKRMKMVGRVEVPQEAFVAALSTGGGGASADKPKK